MAEGTATVVTRVTAVPSRIERPLMPTIGRMVISTSGTIIPSPNTTVQGTVTDAP